MLHTVDNCPRKIYVFDLGGVLINLNVNRCMDAFTALMGTDNLRSVLGMDADGEGVTAVSIASRRLMADFERGLISPDEFIGSILPYCKSGTTTQQITDAWMAMLDDLPAERLNVIARLKATGYPVYLLSNGNDLHFTYINQTYRLDHYFDRMFLSQQMHMAKPEKEIFDAVHQSLTAAHPEVTDPRNIIFIDDIEANRTAASHYVGWTTYPALSSLLKSNH